MAVDSSEDAQYVDSLPVFQDESTTNFQAESKSDVLNFLDVLNPFKTQMCLDTKLNCQDYITLQMEPVDAYCPCSVDVDIEKGPKQIPVVTEEKVISLEAEDSLIRKYQQVTMAKHMQRVMQREINLHMGGKLMRFLIDSSLMLLKFISRDKSVSERAHDAHTPNNRLRKYKRSASFDSRKVGLLFSVLSCMGTLILIYLTLRVRQMGVGDASVPL